MYHRAVINEGVGIKLQDQDYRIVVFNFRRDKNLC